MNLAKIFVGALLVNNIVLMRFIAQCSFFGVTTAIDTALGMSAAVTFVTMLATWVCWVLWHALLVPLGVQFLKIAVFILIIAALVQFLEMYLRKYVPSLYSAMGIYLPLITTNCAVLAVPLLIVDYRYNLVTATIYSLGVCGGYSLVMLLFAAIRLRLEDSPITKSFKGYPMAFVGASLMALAFLGFANLFGITL